MMVAVATPIMGSASESPSFVHSASATSSGTPRSFAVCAKVCLVTEISVFVLGFSGSGAIAASASVSLAASVALALPPSHSQISCVQLPAAQLSLHQLSVALCVMLTHVV